MVGGVSDLPWLLAHVAGAPNDLVARVRGILDQAPAREPLPRRLADAGLFALQQAIGGGRERAAALELLAADALVTLALEATAEQTPGELERFARTVRQRVEQGA